MLTSTSRLLSDVRLRRTYQSKEGTVSFVLGLLGAGVIVALGGWLASRMDL